MITIRQHTIRQHTIALAAAVLSLTALSACDEASGSGSTTGTSPTSPTSPTSSSTPTSEVTPASTGVTIEELADDMRTAEEVVDAFWATHWSEYFTGDYSPPTVVGLYDGNDTSAPWCGDEPLGPGNAFYCPAEDFVAWDAGLMLRGAELGDAWVYLVIAHEWGHAIQARLSPELQAAASEPQADCLAGAALYGAAADGRLTMEEGDEKEIVESLSALADELAWTTTADHGDAFERIDSFDAGRLGGVTACLPE